MFYLKNILILILLAIIQSAIVPIFGIRGIVPDVVLIYLVFICSFRKRHEGVILGFTGGLLQDIISGGRLGISALSKSIAFFLAGTFPGNRYDKSLTLFILSLFITSFVDQFIRLLFYSHHDAVRLDIIIFRYVIPTSLYTCIVGTLLFALIIKWKQKKKL